MIVDYFIETILNNFQVKISNCLRGEIMLEHITITNLELNFPYMIGTLENGEKRKVDIREIVELFKDNKYAYPHMQQLLSKEFFEKAKLGAWDVNWHELDSMVDMDTFIFENAEVVKE